MKDIADMAKVSRGAQDNGATNARRNRRVTSADIAEALGISRATVSYVLNDVPDAGISERTRELVKATAERLGHVPNASARALRAGRSSIVLALLPTFSRGYVVDSVLDSLSAALAERGLALAAHYHNESRLPLGALWGMISPAVVVALSGLSLPEEAVIKRGEARLVRVHNAVDHHRMGRMQVEYLMSKRHQRIGYLYPKEQTLRSVAEARWEGSLQACRDGGLPDPIRFDVDTQVPDLAEPITTWRREGVTAVCAHNDLIAGMLILALGRERIAVPEAMAVIGNDDAPLARLGITTVAIDVPTYTQFVIDLVFRCLDGDPNPVTSSEDMIRLVVRDSA